VVRVHPEYLEKQKIPPALCSKHIWKERFKDIRSFERYLGRNGIMVVKFFLHVSKNEQKRRFLGTGRRTREELENSLVRIWRNATTGMHTSARTRT
jgi:polyphosphate kinase 2 (PPK2 family)